MAEHPPQLRNHSPRVPRLRVVAASEPVGAPTLSIDCDHCVGQGTTQCDDCVVSYVLDGATGCKRGLDLDADEARQLDLLAEAGLAPVSHFRPRPDVA